MSSRLLCFTDLDNGWLFKYDGMSGRLDKFEQTGAEFEDRVTVQIGKDLYAFSMEPLAAFICQKITESTPSKKVPKCRELCSADHSREDFAVTSLGDQAIYITGGLVDGTSSNSVLIFHTNTKNFSSDVPAMNERRCNHSSTVAGGKVWVFGGSN